MYTINHAIVHKLHKERQGQASVTKRPGALSITAPVEKLVLAIHELYGSKASKGYGRFEADEINYPSAGILRACFREKATSFLEATGLLMTVLATKANTESLATGGYVLMAQLTNEANVSWFVVAIIRNTDGTVIDDNTLEVIDAMHVDLDNLRFAGRVNLTDWAKDEDEIRYVGFLKKRGDVADYFKLFLGCNEVIGDTEETKKLVAALKKFAKDQGLDLKAEEEFLQAAHAYCDERNKADEPLSLEALSNAVWPDEPKKLQSAFVQGDVQISDGFVPDGRSIRGLVRLKYKTPYWSVDLDRYALTHGYAQYNKKDGTLTLKNLPDALKAELNRETGDGS